MTEVTYSEMIEAIKGKTIAIVYVYEKDSAPGAQRYDAWKGDVLAGWIQAVYELKALPLVMDVRTFIEKTAYKTLPKIDYVINLSNGCYELSTLGLVPSICSYWSIPCIPCNASTLLIGENKYISNIIAGNCGLEVPKTLDITDESGITRPFCYGSSHGVRRGNYSLAHESFSQEFVPGFDITIPIMYNPLTERLSTLPAVAYRPHNYDPEWFLGEDQKKTHSEYAKQIINIDALSQDLLIKTAESFGITTFCRIDTRHSCSSSEEMKEIFNNGITTKSLKFIEINPLPTIKNEINFLTSLKGIDSTHPIYTCLKVYKNNIDNHSLVGFILCCSIIAITAKH